MIRWTKHRHNQRPCTMPASQGLLPRGRDKGIWRMLRRLPTSSNGRSCSVDSHHSVKTTVPCCATVHNQPWSASPGTTDWSALDYAFTTSFIDALTRGLSVGIILLLFFPAASHVCGAGTLSRAKGILVSIKRPVHTRSSTSHLTTRLHTNPLQPTITFRY